MPPLGPKPKEPDELGPKDPGLLEELEPRLPNAPPIEPAEAPRDADPDELNEGVDKNPEELPLEPSTERDPEGLLDPLALPKLPPRLLLPRSVLEEAGRGPA